MDRFQQEIIELSLDRLFNQKSHFSICDVDKMAEILRVNCKSHQDYKTLSALHCVDYSEMSEALKSELPGRVMAVLTAKFDTALMAKALVAVATGEIKNLPCIEDS